MRAFEAAARTGSHVAAAREIGVSSAAISQHIRKLEDYLGKQLFVRLSNRIVLTDAGRAVFEGAAAGLQVISDMTEQHLRKQSKSRLTVSCIESVAEKWLVPRLVGYTRAQAGFRFDLRIEADPVDFAQHNIDLRLAYDPSHYPGQTVVPLEQDVVLPLCSPAYLDHHPEVREKGMTGVPGEDLLHTSWGPSFGSRPSWNDWFAAAGLAPAPTAEGSQIGSSAIALDLAREGLGVALGQRMVAGDDLAAGRLIALSGITLPLGRPYCLVYPPAKRHRRHLAGMVAWLGRRSGPDAP